MTPFLDDETFLLQSEPARQLYHEYAAPLPIYDYHSHLPPGQIASNYHFANLHDAWLNGDHYKWRAMRAAGIPERLISGDATPWEKFLAYAETVPQTLRNPLYHWTHLELKRYFGIHELLDPTTAKSIWDRANEQLAYLPVQKLLANNRVAVVCTTDDPADALVEHQSIQQSNQLATRVYPTFRPDKAMLVDQPEHFNHWLTRLAVTSGIDCDRFDSFLDALRQRHDFFHSMGGRLSDHGISFCDSYPDTHDHARQIFEQARAGQSAAPGDAAGFRSFMMLFFGRLDAARGWTKQLHIGPLRNVCGRGLREVGPDGGFDSIGDGSHAIGLSRFLDSLDRERQLPKTILYNVSPADNYMLATMAGNFQDGSIAGKIQFGSAWWFLDQKQGIESQLDTLSNVGLLSRFVGMLTDSRSFLSFPRHEYFRRILCNVIGRDVVNGELPNDIPLLGQMVADICFHNAVRYFGLSVPARI